VFPIPTLARALVLVAVAAMQVLLASPAGGQEPPDTSGIPTLAGTSAEDGEANDPEYDEFAGRVGPGGALLRALLVPGWGHASIGSHGRGGFYLGTQAVVGWMLVRTRGRISAAEELETLRAAVVRRTLADEGIDDEVEIEAALAEDERVADARSLVAARQQQWEDWLAVGIFAVFLSGADAFVSAHLQPFPVEVDLVPVNDRGRTELTVRIPVGGGA
jgi:hypothetical protein